MFGQVFGLDHEMGSRGRGRVEVPVAFKARDFDRDVALNSTTMKFLCNI